MSDVDHRFDYRPGNGWGTPRHEAARAAIKAVAKGLTEGRFYNSNILDYEGGPPVPAGREQSLMLTKLEEALFWANAAIARDERNQAAEAPA